MTSDLPQGREEALEAIANGWTRPPTVAHPDCLCGGRAQYTPIKFVESRLPGKWWVQRSWPKTVRCPVHTKRR